MAGRPVQLRWLAGAVLLGALLIATVLVLSPEARPAHRQAAPAGSSSPPARGGYFRLAGVGAWESLPSGSACGARVHRSTWEPRPENDRFNRTVPDPAAVRSSFAARPRSDEWLRWSSWLLPRVDGGFNGTTDEILQWAACKWGLPDELVRAVAANESTWYQHATGPDGRCIHQRGCGDFWASDPVYCRAISRHGYDYEALDDGHCPGTFSIAGVMAFQHPDWGLMAEHQNGTFPFSRDSTAFAADYLGATIRGCYEGWMTWLRTQFPAYGAGDIWGCVGVWYSGQWHTPPAATYIANVQRLADTAPWLGPDW